LKDRVSEPNFARTPPGSQPGECQTPHGYLDVDYLRNSGQESKVVHKPLFLFFFTMTD
jgi:hypothetical protein